MDRWLIALKDAEPLAVATPGRAAAVGPGKRRHRSRLGPRPGLDDIDVAVAGAVGVGSPVADEGDRASVRRPDGRPLVIGPRGDRFPLSGLQVIHPEMLMPVDEVSLAILFKMVPVDQNRRLGLPLPALFLFGIIVRGRVVDNEDKTLAVGRPGIIGDTALDVGQAQGLAAAPVEEPDLRPLLFLVFISPR